MKWKTLIDNVEQWAYDREIITNSDTRTQLMKAVSEMGELCDAEIKDACEEQVDAVGDILVCLIIYCEMKGFTLKECLEQAYNEIKDRKGYMSHSGVFIKEITGN